MSTPDQAYGGGARQYATGGQTTTAPSAGYAQAGQQAGVQQAETTARAVRGGPRKVRLTLSRVDPWSVAKIGFLLSVAIGIAFVIMIGVLWTILDGMGVFADIDRTVRTVLGENGGSTFDLMQYVGFGRVLSLATVIGVIDVFLLTALTTLGAFLYNICSALVGGVQLTLTDD
ncbi:DUF3566 domain-containing protein [Angustibacter aerolatus]